MDKILDRLAKLKAMQLSEAAIGNEAAAQAFAAAVNKMLLEHELSEMDIPLAGQSPEDPMFSLRVDLDAYGIKRVKSRIGWQEALAHIVAKANLCKFLVIPGSNVLTFVGTKPHAIAAEFTYGILAAAANKMSLAARASYWYRNSQEPNFTSGNFRAAWLRGFINRVGERLAETKRAEVSATSNSGTAMVRLDTALVRVEAYVKATYGGKTTYSTKLGVGCREGQQAGRDAADRMHLGKGLGASQQQKGLVGR